MRRLFGLIIVFLVLFSSNIAFANTKEDLSSDNVVFSDDWLKVILHQDKSTTIIGKAANGERKAMISQRNPFGVEEVGNPFQDEYNYSVDIDQNGNFTIKTKPVSNQNVISFQFSEGEGLFFHNKFEIFVRLDFINNYKYTKDQLEALEYLNDIRVKAGLNKIKLNPFMSKAAENHAKYIEINHRVNTGASAHFEKAGDPEFTGNAVGERVRVVGGGTGANEVISFIKPGSIDGIKSWLSTAYHRVPLTNPNTFEIGLGKYGGTIVGITTEIGDDGGVTVYPYNGMTEVGIGFYGEEDPNPLEHFNVFKSGYIISLQAKFDFKEFEASITDSSGGKVPFYYQNIGTLFLYPAYELSYGEKYIVSVDYTVDGITQNKTWSFTTKNIDYKIYPDYTAGIKINGKVIPDLSPSPLVQSGSTYVPLRGIFERLNATLEWDESTRTVTIKKQNTTVNLTIDSTKAYVNDKEVSLSQAPFIVGGSTYVPLRFISETFGAKVGWDNTSRIVNLDVDLGEPVNVMAVAMSKPKARMDSKMNPIREIVKKFGYSMNESMDYDFNYSSNVIKDNNGMEIATYTQSLVFEDNSSIYMKEISVPRSESQLLFIQEVVESLSGSEIPSLASTLMKTINNPPPLSEAQSWEIEVNSMVKCNFNYQFYTDNKFWDISLIITH
jgi:uncharacterized protein YkwD